jgi:uncharacterized protein
MTPGAACDPLNGDSGLVHALQGIAEVDTLLGHPVVGASWEGFVNETLLTAAPDGTDGRYYRKATSANSAGTPGAVFRAANARQDAAGTGNQMACAFCVR